MRKKFVCICLIILLICAVTCAAGGVSASSCQTVNAEDVDGNIKVFYQRPESVASAQIGDCYMVIVGDRNMADKTASLVIYFDDGENSGVFRHALADETVPLKMQIYQNYVFVYDDKNEKIQIYQILSPDRIQSAGEIAGYDDYSVAGGALFLLSNYDVYKYSITEDDINGLIIQQQEHYSFAEKPSEIAAIDDENFIVKLGADTIYIADMQGNAEPLLTGARFYTLLNYHNGILYYYSDKIYAYDTAEGVVTASMQIGGASIPLSKDIVNISNIFVDASGVYVADWDLKKVSRFSHNLAYDNFVLCSFSNDAGRFNSPAGVSAAGAITVADNNRIQIFGGGGIRQFRNLSFNPKFAFNIAGGGAVAVAESGAIYTENNGVFQQIANLNTVVDAKLDASGIIYILSENSLYVMNYIGQFQKLLDISGARKIAVNNKTRNIYLLTQNGISIYGGEGITTIPITDITQKNVEFSAIETDFGGCIYLLCGDYAGDGAAVVKYDGENTEVFLLEGGIFDGAESLNIDYVTGDAYFVSKSAHAAYKIPKAALGIAVAGDIPLIELPSDPEDADASHYAAAVIEIVGYPSTMFYPFNGAASGQDYYPQNLAHTGEILALQSGTKLLSIYDNGEYHLAFYNGKLGFVLTDNVTLSQNLQPQFAKGETLLTTAVYALPYLTYNDECDFVKTHIEKWQAVDVLARLPSYLQSETDWLYIEYDGERGYINAANVMPYSPRGQSEYIGGSLTAGGQVNLYADASAAQKIGALDGGTNIKIYYYSGDYAYISADVGGEEVFGYILKSAIAAGNTFQKQKTGFLLLAGTIALAVIFLIFKKKFFS